MRCEAQVLVTFHIANIHGTLQTIDCTGLIRSLVLGTVDSHFSTILLTWHIGLFTRSIWNAVALGVSPPPPPLRRAPNVSQWVGAFFMTGGAKGWNDSIVCSHAKQTLSRRSSRSIAVVCVLSEREMLCGWYIIAPLNRGRYFGFDLKTMLIKLFLQTLSIFVIQ